MIQNAMMVSGLRSASSAGQRGAAGGVVRAARRCRTRPAWLRARPRRTGRAAGARPPAPAPRSARATARREPPPTSSPRCAAGRDFVHVTDRRHAMHTRLKVAAAAVHRRRHHAGRVGAQGIPVIDVANLIQTDPAGAERRHPDQQPGPADHRSCRTSSTASTASAMLGTVFNNPMLRNYVAGRGLHRTLNAVDTLGLLRPERRRPRRCATWAWSTTAWTSPATRAPACQATLAQPYQQKGLLQDAMKSAAGRLSQIQSLMGQINATTDQKAVQEIQARIGAENAAAGARDVAGADAAGHGRQRGAHRPVARARAPVPDAQPHRQGRRLPALTRSPPGASMPGAARLRSHECRPAWAKSRCIAGRSRGSPASARRRDRRQPRVGSRPRADAGTLGAPRLARRHAPASCWA
ncbi:MAG: type IV secretion system protein [Comamonadaceae bacterium]|nr:type IV secretion system protein [Comamonadaceae bacterium]